MKKIALLFVLLFGGIALKAQEQISPDGIGEEIGGPTIPITISGQFAGISNGGGSVSLIKCDPDPFSKCFTFYLPILFRGLNDDDNSIEIEIYSRGKIIQRFEARSIKENKMGTYEFEIK